MHCTAPNVAAGTRSRSRRVDHLAIRVHPARRRDLAGLCEYRQRPHGFASGPALGRRCGASLGPGAKPSCQWQPSRPKGGSPAPRPPDCAGSCVGPGAAAAGGLHRRDQRTALRAARLSSADPNQRRVAASLHSDAAVSPAPGCAQSAAATLASPLLYVRRCAGEGCSLFFTDDSPTQSRRWCSMAVCGREVRIERRRGLLR